MNNIKNNDELKDNNQNAEHPSSETNKKETGTKSIIFLPFDLNVSNPEIKDPYTRIRSGKSSGKRNKLSDILKDPNEKVKGILVNLYGGIVKTTVVAEAFLKAYENNLIDLPIQFNGE